MSALCRCGHEAHSHAYDGKGACLVCRNETGSWRACEVFRACAVEGKLPDVRDLIEDLERRVKKLEER